MKPREAASITLAGIAARRGLERFLEATESIFDDNQHNNDDWVDELADARMDAKNALRGVNQLLNHAKEALS